MVVVVVVSVEAPVVVCAIEVEVVLELLVTRELVAAVLGAVLSVILFLMVMCN